MAPDSKPPKSFQEIIDVIIGEVAFTRRKMESLLELLDEKGLITREEFKNKFKEKTEDERLGMLMEGAGNKQ